MIFLSLGDFVKIHYISRFWVLQEEARLRAMWIEKTNDGFYDESTTFFSPCNDFASPTNLIPKMQFLFFFFFAWNSKKNGTKLTLKLTNPRFWLTKQTNKGVELV